MICCPLTTQIKNDPFEAFIGGTPPNAILADRVKSIDWRSRDAKPKGLVSTEQLKVSKWAGTMVVQPDARTGPHHHEELETVLYVKSRIRMRWGDQLEFSEEARPGDFIYVPPYVRHQEINASPDEPCEAVVVRDGAACFPCKPLAMNCRSCFQ